MKRILVLSLLLQLMLLFGCSEDRAPVEITGPETESPDEASIVIANCLAVREAVERFASQNGSIYPGDVDTDTTSAGSTVMDLLPGGQGLENPFTKSQTVPVNGTAASPGEIGYMPISQDDWNVGYIITGFGSDSLIVELTNIESPEEALVRANCLIVQSAAEQCAAQNGGVYPDDDYFVYYDGIMRYLPGRRPLENPFTGLRTEPVGHTAVSPGETGYTAIRQDGVNVGYVITGFGNASIIVAISNPEYSYEEALVVANCRTVQLAAAGFAIRNGSEYPAGVRNDCTPSGQTLLDLLPGGRRLENPFTGLRTEPVDRAAENPGEIGYEAFERYGWNIGCVVTGFGESSLIVESASIESPEEIVMRTNCLMLRSAVEEFAALNNGLYPENVDSDATPGGETVLDLLPRGHLLENPYTKIRTEPVNHTAVNPGETGYALALMDRVNSGYVISGFGESSVIVVVTNLGYMPREALVISNCRTVQLAADEFAARNDGVYPSNVNVDVTPGGETLIDLLPGGRLLENPFTRIHSEPVDVTATNPGETGYVPVFSSAPCTFIGCVITGAGRHLSIIITIPDYPGMDDR